ncbi:hypothetical protein LCGC14_3128360, partial [marine sediment metagenome]
YGVDIVFGGDNHYYSRHDVNGVQHITTGGGGAPLYTPSSSAEYQVAYSKSFHHCEITIADDQMTVLARKNDGTVLDTKVITHVPDIVPPTPDPATFSSAPSAYSDSDITMTATTGTDATLVWYNFDCTAGGGNDSGWQMNPVYNDTGLDASTQYTYTVQMRDSAGTPNVGTASDPANATTYGGPDTAAPTPNPATFSSAPSADSSSAISMTATTGSDSTGPVEYYFNETTDGNGATDSGWQTSASYTDSGLDASTQYTYTVQMRDSAPTPNVGTASDPENATTDAEPVPPAAPSGLSATAISKTEIDLSWTDNADNETGFKIERSKRVNTAFAQVATVGA